MRILSLVAALGVCVHAYGQLHTPQSVPNNGPQSPLLLESPTAWEDWLAGLTLDELDQVSRHKGGISTHPPMTINAMGISYPPIRFLPLATFHRELEGYPGTAKQRLVEVFNIELNSPGRKVDWPSTATLRVELSNEGRYVHLGVPMQMQGDGIYYLASPSAVVSELDEAVGELGQFPRMQFTALEGFTLNSETIEDLPPLGAPITYNFRFGGVRVDTGYQWAGRPKGPFMGASVDFLK